jgi:hypothetical protein
VSKTDDDAADASQAAEATASSQVKTPPRAPETPASPAVKGREGAGPDAVVVARRLSLAGARTIGLLPVGATGDLLPLLVDLAGTLALFAVGAIGCIGSWRTWKSKTMRGMGALRTPAPGAAAVVVISPPACGDLVEAAAALERTLVGDTRDLARVLVDLGGYARPGGVPTVAELVDGVVLVAEARRSLRRNVGRIAELLPHRKNLGAILVG